MTQNINMPIRFLGSNQQKPTLAILGGGKEGELIGRILKITESMRSEKTILEN